MILIDPDRYRRMPWKNGGGTTIEIAVSPAGTIVTAMAMEVTGIMAGTAAATAGGWLGPD